MLITGIKNKGISTPTNKDWRGKSLGVAEERCELQWFRLAARKGKRSSPPCECASGGGQFRRFCRFSAESFWKSPRMHRWQTPSAEREQRLWLCLHDARCWDKNWNRWTRPNFGLVKGNHLEFSDFIPIICHLQLKSMVRYIFSLQKKKEV